VREVFLPSSLSELWREIEREPEAAVYAGGTDLFVKMRHGFMNPASLICIDRIRELKGIFEEGNSIRIGASTTHTQILEDPRVRSALPVLVGAVRDLGSPPIRNMGTIGGNICTASPAGDTLPPLYVLDAEVELRRENSARRMRIKDFIVGPGKTLLERGEVLAAVWVGKPEGYNVHHFEKVGQRNALACSIASLASLLLISGDGVVQKAALAWGSVAPTVLTCPEAEETLIGEKLSFEKLQKAAAMARNAVCPIDDVRADAEYRRQVSGNLLLRLMEVSNIEIQRGRGN
jgi:xanthine dehydrogenase FAD-binding subunit